MSAAAISHAGPRVDAAAAPRALDLRALRQAMAPFQTQSLRLGVWQLTTTLTAYLAVNAAMYAALKVSVWLCLALAPLAAGLVVRLFIIQHDCGHGAFFRSKRANDVLGWLLSPITWTPYAFWRRQHNDHHAAFNNLDRRGSGLDVYSTCATVEEYARFSSGKRLLYRAAHHPLLTQLILPPIIFVLLYRVPFGSAETWRRDWAGVLGTNLAIAGALAALAITLGAGPMLTVQLPIVVLAAIVGTWLFCVQHRFEESAWAREADWRPADASLHGSSFLKLPRVLQWFTGSIGYHHVHHLDARIPNYRLQACHEAVPALHAVTTLSLREGLLAPGFDLWDEAQGRMVRYPRESGRAPSPAGERRPYRPFQAGGRFSAKARGPSTKSSQANRAATAG